MIKFWASDFRYTKRFGKAEPFGYLFQVRSESANYLINRYRLAYPDVFVNCYNDKTIYVGSRATSGLTSDIFELRFDDVDELYMVLEPTIKADIRNYEEYKSDDWYQKDSRWE